jgi:CRP-like cAMP-binding protein
MLRQADWRAEGPCDRILAGLVAKFGLRHDPAHTLFDLLGPTERYPAGAVVSSVSPEPLLKWIISGWACEVRILPDGRQQIFSFAIPGDILTSRPPRPTSPCSAVALTDFECVDLARVLTRVGRSERTEVQKMLDQTLTLALERRYDAMIRIGRHSAVHRVAALLMEFFDRLEAVGMADDDGYFLPLTQKHLADALGMSVVQVNRSLKALRDAGLATFRFRRVTSLDRRRVEELCRG